MTAQQNPEFHDRLEACLKKLQPASVQASLIRAGLFLAGWELLRAEVQGKVKGFFSIGFDEAGETYSTDYETRVLARHKSAFEASLLWLVEANALTVAQAECVRRIRTHRNVVAHELPTLLVDPGKEVDADLLREMQAVLGALGRFWGRIEVDISPDFDGVEVQDEGIQSGSMLLMQHMIDAAKAIAHDPAVGPVQTTPDAAIPLTSSR